MSLSLAVPGFGLLAVGIVVLPALIVNDIAAHLRHWRNEHD